MKHYLQVEMFHQAIQRELKKLPNVSLHHIHIIASYTVLTPRQRDSPWSTFSNKCSTQYILQMNWPAQPTTPQSLKNLSLPMVPGVGAHLDIDGKTLNTEYKGLGPGEDWWWWNGRRGLQPPGWLAEPHHGSQQVPVTPPFHCETATPTTHSRHCDSWKDWVRFISPTMVTSMCGMELAVTNVECPDPYYQDLISFSNTPCSSRQHVAFFTLVSTFIIWWSILRRRKMLQQLATVSGDHESILHIFLSKYSCFNHHKVSAHHIENE
jgi:hypothetical protein